MSGNKCGRAFLETDEYYIYPDNHTSVETYGCPECHDNNAKVEI